MNVEQKKIKKGKDNLPFFIYLYDKYFSPSLEYIFFHGKGLQRNCRV